MSKVWLITGSSRGLGRAIAEAVLDAGDLLVATARRPERLADLVERGGDRARAVALDVTDPDAARAAVAAAVEAFGRVDVVVNNAGYANLGTIEDTPLEDFESQVATNLWGPIHVTRAALPVLRAQGTGHIVQVSTIGGRRAFPALGPYHTAKWGLEGFSETLAAEVAPLGIRVTIVEPGGLRTDWAGSSMAQNDVGSDYAPAIGPMAAAVRSLTPVGDPALAAQAILRAVAAEQPPLRLPLGSDALLLIRAGDEARLAEIDRWEELSRSSDAADAELPDLGAIAG